MGFEGFNVKMLALLLCLVRFDIFVRAWALYFVAEVYDTCVLHDHDRARRHSESRILKKGTALHPCDCWKLLRRMCAAPQREHNFENQPPSIPVTVGNF